LKAENIRLKAELASQRAAAGANTNKAQQPKLGALPIVAAFDTNLILRALKGQDWVWVMRIDYPFRERTPNSDCAPFDGRAFLQEITFYMHVGQPVPPPVAQEWVNRCGPWLCDQVETLDEAFDARRPKGQHFDDLRRRSALRPEIVMLVSHIQRTQGLPISSNSEIWADAAGQLKLSERYVRETYNDKESRPFRAFWKFGRVSRALAHSILHFRPGE
jgi:hypothetical protein